jgi:uncharacterized protein YdiU (UPF0061 family)
LNFSSQNDLTTSLLADFIIKYYFHEIKGNNKESYNALLHSVTNQLEMIVHWQCGFVHGVNEYG